MLKQSVNPDISGKIKKHPKSPNYPLIFSKITNFKNVLMLVILLGLMLGFERDVFAQVIFSENYDSTEWNNWNCSMGIVLPAHSQSACESDTYNGTTHYCGETVSPGRDGTGRALAMWRHNGEFGNNYCGYLNYQFTQEEFDNHHKELFVRWYMKIPSDWDATGSLGVRLN